MSRDGRADLDPAALIAASESARRVGDHARAADEARRAARQARADGDRRLAARADALLALDLWRLNEEGQALSVAMAALPDTDALGPPAWGVELRNTLAIILSADGRFIEALAHATEALARARSLADPALISWSLTRLAIVYEDLDERDKAIELFEEAARTARQGSDPDALFAAYINLIGALNSRAGEVEEDGDRARAVEQARQSLAVVQAAAPYVGDNATRRLHYLSSEFVAQALLGDHQAMARIADEYQALASELALPRKLQRSRLMRAEVALARGDADEACVLCEQLQSEAPDIDASVKHRSLRVAFKAYKAAGRLDRALAALEALRRAERAEARTQIQAHARALLRDTEIERAQREAERLRKEAADLDAKASAAERESLQDALTGIANRRALDQRLRAIGIGSAADAPWVAVVDIDHFKRVNDQHGHEVGDRVLRQVAGLLVKATRDRDFVARSGGEEFVILLAVDSIERAGDVCTRLLRAIEAFDWSGILPHGGVTVSIGLAQPTDPDGVPGALRRADAALYDAKHGGRNRYCVR